MVIILGELGSKHILLEIEGALSKSLGKENSWIWCDPSIIFRDQWSTDPLLGCLKSGTFVPIKLCILCNYVSPRQGPETLFFPMRLTVRHSQNVSNLLNATPKVLAGSF